MADDLRAKYGDAALEAGRRQQPKNFEKRLTERDSLDQHFTRLWLDFAVAGMGRRSVLDTRTRLSPSKGASPRSATRLRARTRTDGYR